MRADALLRRCLPSGRARAIVQPRTRCRQPAMSFRVVLILLACTLATVLSASDSVVTAHPLKGRVLVNEEEVFLAAGDGHVLHAGDRVLLLSGAVARISYSDGCQLQLAGPRMVRIQAAAPCAGFTTADAQSRPKAFDGAGFFARVDALGRVEPEDYLDALGP